MQELIGYIFAMLVGISLGMLGSGGSILTVPIMVYLLKVMPSDAIVYSLFVVGVTSIIGGFTYIRKKLVDWKTALLFAMPSVISVYITRQYLLPLLPDPVIFSRSFQLTRDECIMLVFSMLMIIAGYRMIFPRVLFNPETDYTVKKKYSRLVLIGLASGVLTGLFGVGGGFIIIPALVLFAGVPIRMSVGTSLLIIAFNSFTGFLEEMLRRTQDLNYAFLLKFALMSVIGIYLGYLIAMRLQAVQLKRLFGFFIISSGIIIICREVLILFN
jgi:uncharacterized membrane protein YfcA